jgi:hypothetical protein
MTTNDYLNDYLMTTNDYLMTKLNDYSTFAFSTSTSYA